MIFERDLVYRNIAVVRYCHVVVLYEERKADVECRAISIGDKCLQSWYTSLGKACRLSSHLLAVEE